MESSRSPRSSAPNPAFASTLRQWAVSLPSLSRIDCSNSTRSSAPSPAFANFLRQSLSMVRSAARMSLSSCLVVARSSMLAAFMSFLLTFLDTALPTLAAALRAWESSAPNSLSCLPFILSSASSTGPASMGSAPAKSLMSAMLKPLLSRDLTFVPYCTTRRARSRIRPRIPSAVGAAFAAACSAAVCSPCASARSRCASASSAIAAARPSGLAVLTLTWAS